MTPESQHADDEDDALHDDHPAAELGQVVLHGDEDGGTHYRAEHGPEASQQRHQHHFPDMPQCTSVSEASWKTIDLVLPASPTGLRRGRRRSACTDRPCSRARWRVSFSRIAFNTCPKASGQYGRSAGSRTGREHDEVERQRIFQIENAEHHAARIAWMPSSPPVKGACRQKKNSICARARVIMAK